MQRIWMADFSNQVTCGIVLAPNQLWCYHHSNVLTSLVLMFPLVTHTDFYFLPSGECHFLPSCSWHTGYCGLRWTLQLLGQRRSHQVEDLGAARPAHHGLLLQPQWQHLCICFQLWLVEGRRPQAGVCSSLQWLKSIGMYHIFFILIPQGHEYYNPQKKNYIFLRNAAEELKPRNKKWWEKGNHCP